MAYHVGPETELFVVDVEAAEVLRQRSLDIRPSLTAFDRSGTTLVLYGSPFVSTVSDEEPPPPRLLVLSSDTLQTQWEQALSQVQEGSWCVEACDRPHGQRLLVEWKPAVVLSPAGDQLHIVHAEEDRITTLDLDRHTVVSRPISPPQSWLERLLSTGALVAEAKEEVSGAVKDAALSPDGRLLYLVGRTAVAESQQEGGWLLDTRYLGLQVIDLARGLVVATRETEATRIRVTPDGAFLILDGWGPQTRWTEVVDAQSLQTIRRFSGWRLAIGRRIGGERLYLASFDSPRGTTQFAVLAPSTFEIVHFWNHPESAQWVADY